MPEKYIDDLAGWAGDLHQVMLAVLRDLSDSDKSNAEAVYQRTKDFLGSSSYGFPMEDLFADADAVNLYKLTKDTSIESVIMSYYSTGVNTRMVDFARAITGNKNPSHNDLQRKAATYTTSGKYGQGWPILEGQKISPIQGEVFAKAFADWIYGFIQLCDCITEMM